VTKKVVSDNFVRFFVRRFTPDTAFQDKSDMRVKGDDIGARTAVQYSGLQVRNKHDLAKDVASGCRPDDAWATSWPRIH
jgi:hypothetical protein